MLVAGFAHTGLVLRKREPNHMPARLTPGASPGITGRGPGGWEEERVDGTPSRRTRAALATWRSAYEEKVYNLAQPFMLAEVAIMLWLAIMGAKEQRLAAAES